MTWETAMQLARKLSRMNNRRMHVFGLKLYPYGPGQSAWVYQVVETAYKRTEPKR